MKKIDFLEIKLELVARVSGLATMANPRIIALAFALGVKLWLLWHYGGS